jgi:Uma2 family endonuclease
MSAKTLLTVEQFEQLPDDDVRYELDEGELVEVAGANYKHNDIRDHMTEVLRVFLRANRRIGRAIAEQEFRLSAGTVRRPDVALIAEANLANIEQNRSIQNFAPDLVIEITSPSDTFDSLTRRTRQYFAAGTKTVWIVATTVEEIHVFSKGGRTVVLQGDEALTQPDLLPGFSLRVGELFGR